MIPDGGVASYNPQEEMTFKGVVFNEMKGVYSSPDSVYYRAVQQVRHDRQQSPYSCTMFPTFNPIDVRPETLHHRSNVPYCMLPLAVLGEVQSLVMPLSYEALSDIKYLLLHTHCSLQALFTSNTYRHDSGGDPTQIPDLKYEEFQEFHAKYYHPSNAR
jgi:hypothetical protein